MKPRTDLLPSDVLLAVAAVLGDGAAEHGERNWEAGDRTLSDHYASATRHLFRFATGEDRDASGHLHLVHAAARLMMMAALQLRQVQGTDDRHVLVGPAHKPECTCNRNLRVISRCSGCPLGDIA